LHIISYVRVVIRLFHFYTFFCSDGNNRIVQNAGRQTKSLPNVEVQYHSAMCRLGEIVTP
jgi:hypothetical protein